MLRYNFHPDLPHLFWRRVIVMTPHHNIQFNPLRFNDLLDHSYGQLEVEQ